MPELVSGRTSLSTRVIVTQPLHHGQLSGRREVGAATRQTNRVVPPRMPHISKEHEWTQAACNQYRRENHGRNRNGSSIPSRFPSILLERDGDGDTGAGAGTVIHVVPIVGVIKIYVVGFVPRCRPHFRPRINECDPIAVVAEAWIPANENHRQAVDAEIVRSPPVGPEAVFRYAVAVIAAALSPSVVVVIPRLGPRLGETAVHLLFLLWDAAVVDATIGRAGGLDAAVIGAAVARSRFFLRLHRPLSLLLTLWLRGLLMRLLRGLLTRLLRGLLMRLLRGLLMRLLRGFRLLMLLPWLRFALLLTVFLFLCVGRGRGSENPSGETRTL